MPSEAALNRAIASGDYAKCLTAGAKGGKHSAIGNQSARTGRLTGGAMSEAFRDISPEAPGCSRLLAGCLPICRPLRRLFFPRCGSGVK